MADNLLGFKQPDSLLGDVRDDYISRAKELRLRAEKNQLTQAESNAMRKNHPSSSYFEAIANWNAIDDPVVTPLINMIVNQPSKSMSDIFSYDNSSKDPSFPQRGSFLEGLYKRSKDKVYLIRDPHSKDIGMPPDLRGFLLTNQPFRTKISDDNTAAHEIIHAGLSRDVTEYDLNARTQHKIIDHAFAKSLYEDEDYWKEKYGEDDYKRELVNKISGYVFSNESGNAEIADLIKNVDSIPTSELKEILEKLNKRGPGLGGSYDYGKLRRSSSMDEKIKSITGKPESEIVRGRK